MKQTATEFLFEKLWETPKDKLTWNAILEQAKEMEKQQIKDAYFQGGHDMERNNYRGMQQYYKETYDK
jgi:2-iminoacetate synthase ThiH